MPLPPAPAEGRQVQLAYRLAGPRLRRLINEAFFEKLLLDDDGTVRAELAEPFASLLGDELAAEQRHAGR
jgi:hypothetical protein